MDSGLDRFTYAIDHAKHAELIVQINRENTGADSLLKVRDRVQSDAGLTRFAVIDMANSLQI